MKKIYKILFILIFSLLILSINKNVKANTINQISMDIYVDKNGDAYITEIWECNVNQGTESYHPYYNLGNSNITDLSVSEKGRQYTTLNSWNTSGSLNSKAYKCGINKISNGVELCWGISNYGSHEYTVKYKISNFVSSLTDSQMIYWTLIPYDFSTPIGNAYIKIYSDFNISNATHVWGYGNYGGTASVYNGYIEMQSDGRLDTNEYMTILVKFPQNTFNATNKLNYNFEYYYNMAQEGATKYVSSYNSNSPSIETVLKYFIIFFLIIFVFIITLIVSGISNSGYDFSPKDKKITKNYYYRDIPCNGDLLRAYYIAFQFNILCQKTDLLGAIILKWLKDSIIRIDKIEKGKIFLRENTVIILNETDTSIFTNKYEKELFEMLYSASIDGILESKEFEKWCKKSYLRILKWFDDIMSFEKKELINEKLILVETRGSGIFTTKRYHPTPELKEQAEQLAGLKDFLLNYTLTSTREAIEVHIFENYLIYAQILGIAKKVAKEFNDIYPEIIEESKFYDYNNIVFIQTCADRGIYSAQSADSSSSSDGFSSGGGGGGSFGGGGGRWWFPLKNLISYNVKRKTLLLNFFV